MLLSFVLVLLDGICTLSVKLPRPSESNLLQISPPDLLLETYTGQVLGTMVKYAIHCHSFDGSTSLMSKSRIIWAPSSVWRHPNLPRVAGGPGETAAIAFWHPPFSMGTYGRADLGQLHAGYMLTRTAHPPGTELDTG